MAKCIQFFSGTNSYGKTVEVAQSISGAWFSRYYDFNGYQVAATKWQALSEPNHPLGYTNEYDGKFYAYTEQEQKERIVWGFNELKLVEGYTKARLPN